MSATADKAHETVAEKKSISGRRHATRELLVQALYQWQLTGADAGDLIGQFSVTDGMRNADREYFNDTLRDLLTAPERLAALVDPVLDRPWVQLDPVERGILMLAAFELSERLEIPYRVVINEAIDLAWQFGAEGSHKYVNGVLDKMAAKLRSVEVQAASQAAS